MLRRAVAQRTILATVLAVAVVGSTLLGTFALLLTSSEHRALTVALIQSPATATDLDVQLAVGRNDPTTAIEIGRTALDDVLGAIPSTRTEWVQSRTYRLPDDGGQNRPLGYFSSVSGIEEFATLRSGSWPTTVTDAKGRFQIAIPRAAAEHFAWSVGSTFIMDNASNPVVLEAIVVGIFDATGDPAIWKRDRIDGAGMDPRFPVPGSFGFLVTNGFGPLVTVPEALLTTEVTVERATIVAHPQLDGVSADALDGARNRLTTAYRDVAKTVGTKATTTVFISSLAPTIDSARGQLAVTRVGLVVLGLMLMVLAITVLLLAARLLAERRATEQSLMASRGATSRQVLALATLEALLVAGLTTAVAPLLARLLYRRMTAQDVFRRAGLDVDPHLPGELWLTCAFAALIFGAVLLGPLLRRSTSVVDAEQQQVRQDRRGTVMRSGVDLVLVALAVIAYWQLRQYQSPVLTSGGIDPILVAGPALFLLAGAVVALRLLPIVAAIAEWLAARGRRLVLSLAAWEVGRRPARASGAVLLLTLAVAISVFAQSFLVTWRTSQLDQADIQVGTDVRVDRLTSAPLIQSSAIAAQPGATVVSPAAVRSIGLGAAPAPGTLPSTSTQVGMISFATENTPALVRGIAPAGTDWTSLLATIAPVDTVVGADLPGTPTALRLTVTAAAVPEVTGVLLLQSVIVQDERGVRVSARLPALPIDAQPHEVTVPISAPAGSALVGKLTLVGTISQFIEDLDSEFTTPLTPGSSIIFRVTVADLRAVETIADGDVTREVETAASLNPPVWSAQTVATQFTVAKPLTVETSPDGSISTRESMAGTDIQSGIAGFTMTTFPAPRVLPVVVSDSLLDRLGSKVGDRLLLDMGDTSLSAEIVGSAAYLPSRPEGLGLVVDHDLLTRALLTAGLTDPMLDEWWVGADHDAAATITDTARHELSTSATSRYELGATMTDGPLRIGVQAALWTVTGAALLLAVAGFAMSTTISVRLRRLEFARLEALGASRPSLVRAVVAEQTLLGTLGLAAGTGIGVLLGRLVVPLLTVAPDGGRPIPDVTVLWPVAREGMLLGAMVALLGAAVILTTVALLRPATSSLLRLGDDR